MADGGNAKGVVLQTSQRGKVKVGNVASGPKSSTQAIFLPLTYYSSTNRQCVANGEACDRFKE